MGLRYFRRFPILPGLRANLSKSGMSFTFGGKGFHHTIGAHGSRTTIGLPVRGLSWTTYHRHTTKQATPRRLYAYDRARVWRNLGGLAVSWAVAAWLAVSYDSPEGLVIGSLLIGWFGYQAIMARTTPVNVPIADRFDDTLAFNIDRCNPLQFEQLAAILFRKLGYQVETTPRSGDGGVDLFATDPTPIRGGRSVVQCKHTAVVGAPELRDLMGAVTHHGAHKGILVTSGRFTQPARDWAEGKPLELVDGAALRKLIAEHWD